MEDRTPMPASQALRWPLEPLLASTGHTPSSLARALGLAHSWVQTCKREGLSDVVADRWAVKLGHHPGLVWDGWFEAALEPPQAEPEPIPQPMPTNPPWRWCDACLRRHRIGRACPPRVPAVVGLERLAAHYWWALNAEMADARSVAIADRYLRAA